jgi:hypothetical protein
MLIVENLPIVRQHWGDGGPIHILLDAKARAGIQRIGKEIQRNRSAAARL